jgi:hypothetical protein
VDNDNNSVLSPAESQDEADAIESILEHFDEEVDFDSLFVSELRAADEWNQIDKKYRKRLYVKLQTVYQLYLLARNNPKREGLINQKCKEFGIPITRSSHLSIRLVKLMLRPPGKTPYQYAAALRYATLQQIAPDHLAEELAKKGNGIDKMADRFSADESDEIDEGSGSEPDDDDDDDEAGSRADASDDEEKDQTPEYPQVEWGSKLLKQYREAEVGAKWGIVLKKVTENHVRIMKGSPDKG